MARLRWWRAGFDSIGTRRMTARDVLYQAISGGFDGTYTLAPGSVERFLFASDYEADTLPRTAFLTAAPRQIGVR